MYICNKPTPKQRLKLSSLKSLATLGLSWKKALLIKKSVYPIWIKEDKKDSPCLFQAHSAHFIWLDIFHWLFVLSYWKRICKESFHGSSNLVFSLTTHPCPRHSNFLQNLLNMLDIIDDDMNGYIRWWEWIWILYKEVKIQIFFSFMFYKKSHY